MYEHVACISRLMHVMAYLIKFKPKIIVQSFIYVHF